ncbi:hypothetical protein BTVI_96387 [Pitangus sulphuratus]|nr:hypothetical protein BTVI_96387 [Pitangus sulphuratus]
MSLFFPKPLTDGAITDLKNWRYDQEEDLCRELQLESSEVQLLPACEQTPVLRITWYAEGALTVGLVRQCQTIHGRDRTCIPPRLPPEWVTTLFFIIMGIISLTVTCGLLVASHWRREATKYARWIAFTGMILFCMAALIFPIGFYINEVGGQPYKLPNNTVVGSSVATKCHLQGDHLPWQGFTVSHLGPDSGLLGTHTSKTQDLLTGPMKKIQSQMMQTTEEWMRNYSLESLQLTLEYLVFGVIKGTKVGLLIDVSHMSYGPRLLDFQKDLLCLIDEQLCYKKQLYCLSFSTDISALWESPKTINVHVLHEVRQWIQELEPGQGCNLLKALKSVLTVKGLNSLVLIVGSCPDQSFEILCDYTQQCLLGRKLQIHTVTYDCSNPASLAVLKDLAEAVKGRYHCYSSEGENFDSSDLHLLLQESLKAKDLLKSIKQTFQRGLDGSVSSKRADFSTGFANTAPSSFFPKAPKLKGPLVIQTPNVLAKTSTDWLKTYGLKAKKLNLYQVLAPNAFSPVEEFIPILKKRVSSTLHEKIMMQFEWYDGTVKNIHVDLPVLYNYQKLLTKMVNIYEKRIDWLSIASRRIWGSVCERRVVILVDTSVTNSLYITQIQHSLRLLLEEQMANKDSFNIIAWVLSLQCKGSRNFLSALRRAVEVDFKDKEKHKSQGLYLLTTGIPDQETVSVIMGNFSHTISAYMAEVCRGVDLQLHVCLFSVGKDLGSSGEIPARYADPTETTRAFKEIVQAARGRFHWFGEAGIFESDDITSIVSEMEKAKSYSQKDVKDNHGAGRNTPVRVLAWRPPSAKAEIPPAQTVKEWPQTENKRKDKPRKQPEFSLSVFYTDKGRNVGAVYQKYPKTLCIRKSLPSVMLPKEEEICSSKEWLAKYSIKKLELELPRLMFGPGCTHRNKTVESLHKKVSAKYCSIFPSAEINGVVKHLQFQPKELEIYTDQLERVMQRYIQRIQWLLSGSRRLFGTILEANVCVLIDTSGSMDPHLPHVTKELTSLIWEQLRRNEVRFNLLRFAENTESWKECLVEATDETCHDAVQWVSKFHAHGNTCILPALQKALSFQGVEALYLLTDGKPDTSCSLILEETERLRKEQDIKIHTISFSCADRGANEFLKKLASQTGGRYHCWFGGEDGQLAAHRILAEGLEDEDVC